MNQFHDFHDSAIDSPHRMILVFLLSALLLGIVFKQVFDFIEFIWIQKISSKPFFKHVYLPKSKLTKDQMHILETEFSFYQKLNQRNKSYFVHRVAKFISSHIFQGNAGVYVDDHKKILISATAIMLTFGYRKYMLNSIDKIIIYPKVFYSKTNKAHHKGEFNPAYKAIILSWEDFLHGYNIDNDNFNLGIHEVVHAMHFEFLKPNNTSTSAVIFMLHYNKLKKFLNQNKYYRDKLISSKYLRNYAFTNNFEFIAILIESFIESPIELKTQFPEMYTDVKSMLNFNFPGY